MINLGDRVKDKISGLTGICTGRSVYLYGCTRIAIQAEVLEAGKPIESYWLDEAQCDVVQSAVIKGHVAIAEKPPSGPRPDAQRQSNPR